ncbi:MAG: hypothetical protein JWO08_3421 [Verrucomicrobiaceae bacterium]|nr:hypothetical protein [Verrucomicrobiaceae bacterium]
MVAPILARDPVRWDDLWLNLATELIGIVVTVCFVDYLMERRERVQSARLTAWSTLEQLHRVLWVWRGGSRELDINQFCTLTLGEDFPQAEGTRRLLLELGAQARSTLYVFPDQFELCPPLAEALRQLSDIVLVMEAGPADEDPGRIEQMLVVAANELINALRHSNPLTDMPVRDLEVYGRRPRLFDPSLEAQQRRYGDLHHRMDPIVAL